jgi:hypothetical protein
MAQFQDHVFDLPSHVATDAERLSRFIRIRTALQDEIKIWTRNESIHREESKQVHLRKTPGKRLEDPENGKAANNLRHLEELLYNLPEHRIEQRGARHLAGGLL